MNGDLLDLAAIQALASLPNRDELLAMLVGTMAAPMSKLVRTLNEVPSKFVRTLAAVRDSRPEEQVA
jgi:large subunit ribosomal protein L10